MNENKKAGSQMRITDADLSIIKNTFAENDELLKVLRKVFLPEITEDTPLGQVIDLWMTVKIEDLTPEQALINIKARNTLITHIEQQLLQLKFLAGMKSETVDQTKERLSKDSSK